MPTLLFIIPTLSSYEAFLSDIVDAALNAGHQVHVATQLRLLDGRPIEELSNLSDRVVFHPVMMPRGANPLAALRAAGELRKLVEEVRPDWVQAHFSAAALVCALAKTREWPFTSCVIQGLACSLAKGKARLAAWCGERLAMARLDEMWVLTEDDFEVICSWNSSKARLQKSPGFGCRVDEFTIENFSTEWLHERRVELGIQENETILIYVGRLAAFKGFDKTVQAYQIVKEQGYAVRLLILGAFDPMHSTGLSDEEIKALEADESVVMAGWQEKVAEWLALSDICIFPSEREGMPVCLMEALSMGVPVITSDARGCRDIVRNGYDGCVLSETSAESIAREIILMLTEADYLESMRRNASARREYFDRKYFITEHLNALETHL